MKRIILALSLLLCTTTLMAQDKAMLQEIKNANASNPGIEAHFVQTKHNTVNDKKTVSEGTLYIADSDKMAMHYNAPSTDLLVINGTQFYMKQGKRSKTYNTAKNKQMASLSNTLLSCVRGDIENLAADNDATISTKKTANGYEVTLTSNKKQSRGYAKIVLVYDLKNRILVRMQMDEYNGMSNIYEMSNIKTGGTIASSYFEIPK